jgi:pimeloyl-ACP methyl ester carboxylesterase
LKVFARSRAKLSFATLAVSKMNSNSPIIMLSGMGADARVFESQIESIPQMMVPAWIDPLPIESLASYAARLADKINPGEACFVGGASFGGFVALEMIRHLGNGVRPQKSRK